MRFLRQQVITELPTNPSPIKFTASGVNLVADAIPQTVAHNHAAHVPNFFNVKSEKIDIGLMISGEDADNGKVVMTSDFGWRVSPYDSSKKQFHRGFDLRARRVPLFSIGTARVTEVGEAGYAGKYLKLHYYRSGLTLTFMHLSKILVEKGQKIDFGVNFAITGNSSTADIPEHLHLEVVHDLIAERINPLYVFTNVHNKSLQKVKLSDDGDVVVAED